MSRRNVTLLLGATSLTVMPCFPKTGNAIRFATWNMAGAAPGYFGRGLKGITQWIIDNEVDVCTLQEVDRYSEKSGYVDFPAYMARATGFDAYFVPSSIETWNDNKGQPYREYGNALLSRFPLKDRFHAALSDGPHAPVGIEEWGEDKRVALFGKISVDGQDAWVGGTHLSSTVSPYSPVVRHFQSLNLMQAVKDRIPDDVPIIFGGDCNTMAGSMDIYPLTQAFNCHTRYIGPTWPLDYTKTVQEPNVTLDQLFTRGADADNVCVVTLPELSDHAAVVMDVILPRP